VNISLSHNDSQLNNGFLTGKLEGMEKEQEYKIGANAYEFVQKHRSYLSHVQQAELQAMLKDFAIEQVKNSVVLAGVVGRSEQLVIGEYCDCEHPTLDKSVTRCGNCDRWFKHI